jgi:hypothetical protein
MAGRDLSSGWKTYEVLQKDSAGNYTTRPFSDALGTSGSLPTQPIIKMRLVQDLGWPQAKHHLKDDRGNPRIVKKDDVIWLLKCKPKCWRIYFYVSERDGEKRIIYVLAVCKKRDREDPKDAIKARRVADGIQTGDSAIIAFTFPTG